MAISDVSSRPAVHVGERDPEFIRRCQPWLERYAGYFRPEVRGFENVPAAGPFLVVGNHSGGATPPDMPILMTAWWRERGLDEPVYGLFHSFFLSLPGIGPAVRRAGALDANPAASAEVLRQGGVVLVYPGGDHEAYRPWGDRNRIDFAGRTGFVRLALEQGVPIVPAVSSGAQESIVVLSRGEQLARVMPHLRMWRLKVCPISVGPPWGLAIGLPTVPMPAKVTVQLCPPIDLMAELGEGVAEDPEALELGYRRVTTTMQSVLDQLAAEGTSGLFPRKTPR
jgi:1-acyl-sn-glycerol-3-phosphate acyltransferase